MAQWQMTIPGLWQHALEYQQARGQKAIKCKQFDDGLERGALDCASK